MNELVILIAGVLGTLGFSLLFKVNARHIPTAMLGGLISCGIYLMLDALGANLFVSNFFAMLIAAIVSEIFARVFRAPAAIFLLPCVVPLVPGRGLYYTMSTLISENYNAMVAYGKATLLTGLGIASGMIVASAVWAMVMHFMAKKNGAR
jgi:uncharacterized membrane protein YjjB (DUF3815 family)